jgi:hypothetical protein
LFLATLDLIVADEEIKGHKCSFNELSKGLKMIPVDTKPKPSTDEDSSEGGLELNPGGETVLVPFQMTPDFT